MLSHILAYSSVRSVVVAVFISLGVAIFFVTCAWLELTGSKWLRFFRVMELKSLDLRFLIREPIKPGNHVVIVAVDEETLAHEQSYPLPRGRYAQLVDRLVESGAKVIAFDVMFAEPQNKEQLDRIDREIEAYTKSHPNPPKDDPVLALLRRQRQEFDEDAKLATAFRRALEKNVFVITPVHFVTAEEAERERIPRRVLSEDAYRLLVGSSYLVKNPVKPKECVEYKYFPLHTGVSVLDVVYPLAEASAGLGFVDYALDDDGVVRSEYLVTEYKDEYYPPLGIQALIWYLNLDRKDVVLNFWDSVKLGDIVVPTNVDGVMIINFRGERGTFPTYSLSRVLTGAVDTKVFKDKIVLIGGTAKATGDFLVTPYSARLPGVEKHANLIDCILQKDFIIRQYHIVLRDLLFVLGLGLVMGFLLAFLTATGGLCATVLLWIILAWYCQYEFTHNHIWHNITYPTLTIILSFSLVTVYRFGTEARSKRAVKRVFEQYMQASVVTEVLRHADEIKLGGDVREITIFFSDLAGFSTISEQLTPQAVIAFLNECYDEMAPAILERNAFLDKFWGDAIVAAFGVPIQQPDHAVRACLAALDCQARLEALNKKLAAQGRPQAHARIGLHSGTAVVGNVGSRRVKRFNYTALGDAVNIGARLESANKDFQTSIILSGTTYALAKYAIEARELGTLIVKGRKEPVAVYELLGEINKTPSRKLVLADIFHHGLQMFRKRDWDSAIFAFQKALAHTPNDGPSLVYLRACREFKENPPPDDWAGNLVMKEGKD